VRDWLRRLPLLEWLLVLVVSCVLLALVVAALRLLLEQ
jgi:hypothetical protein